VVVRLNRLARHEAFSGRSKTRPGRSAEVSQLNLLEHVGGRLRLVSVTAEACKPAVIAQDLVERLAQSIHHQYLIEQVTLGEGLLDRASLTPWEGLSDELREANRSPARDIGRKLSRIHATVAPRTGFNEPFSFTAAEEEDLAVQEHERWWRVRLRAGWTYGPQLNYPKRQHPSLAEWVHITPAEQAKDRQAVRSLPRVLADVGLEIVRLSERAESAPSSAEPSIDASAEPSVDAVVVPEQAAGGVGAFE
jgi:hypothetical protein